MLVPSLAKEFCEEKGHDVTDMLNEVYTISVIALYGFLHLKTFMKTCLSISLPFINFHNKVQCVLQDVGSHIATPRTVATETKLGKCIP